MGVKVREKVKGSGEWWIFISHNGQRKSKKVGKDKKLALEAAKKIEARLLSGADFGCNEEQKKETKPPVLKTWSISDVNGPLVYFIQQGKTGPIKIGYTDGELKKRIRSLQTANPSQLRCIGYVKPGTTETECDLHYEFSKYRMAGEWFKPDISILEFISGRKLA